MARKFPITAADFFSNPPAQEAGFTGEFWHRAYNLYLKEVNRDPSRSLDKFDVPRTIRVSHGQGEIDVMVRMEPESREHGALRFTAFPASDGPEPRQVDRWYEPDETRPVLGEGALLDAMNRW